MLPSLLDEITIETVQDLLTEAVDAFEMLNPGGRRGMAGDGPWGRIVPDFADLVAANELDAGAAADALRAMAARRRNFSAAEVSRIERILGWIELLPAKGRQRRLMAAVLTQRARGGSQVDWKAIRVAIGSKDRPDTLRMCYRRSLASITALLKAAGNLPGDVSSPGIVSQ